MLAFATRVLMCVSSLKHALCSQTGQHSVHAAGHRPWARRRRRRGRTKTRTLPGQRTSKVGMHNQSCVVALHACVMALQSRKHNCVQVYIASPSRPTSYAAAFTIT